MQVVYSSRTVPTYQTMWYHNAEEQNLNAVGIEREVMKLMRLVGNGSMTACCVGYITVIVQKCDFF